ncbi:C69 family dipeptidase [Chloroflexota bacterium]
MCDTLVTVGGSATDSTVIFAKNSDREPNEAQTLTYVPRTRHEPGSMVECTYLTLPQVTETYEVILSRPFWMWGCEMGGNEFGVAIGNEAVFTKEPMGKEPGLIGMDMVRLALERARSARQALDTIVDLLEQYGQSGNCGFHHKLYYHNSFLIADPGEAWVMETAGSFWAAERVRGVRTISNGLTIGNRWDLASPGLVEHALEKGWCRSRDDFDFGRCYSDFLMTRFDGCRARQRRSTQLLTSGEGAISVKTMMDALRDHGPEASEDPTWSPGRGLLMESLCVHASNGLTRPSQSTGAMVAHLAPDLPTYWLTGTSGTCTGVFKPVYLGGAGLPDLGGEPAGTSDPRSLWWTHELLHRAVIRDYSQRMALYRDERDALEARFLGEAAQACARYRGEGHAERARPLADVTRSCFERAKEATVRWTEAVLSTPVPRRLPSVFSLAWTRFDRQASMAHEPSG